MNNNRIKLKYQCPRTDRTYNGFLWIRVNDQNGGSFVQLLNEDRTIYDKFTPRWLSFSESEALARDVRYVDKLFSFSNGLNCHDVRKFKKFLRKHPELVGKCTLVHQYRYTDQSLGYSLDVEG